MPDADQEAETDPARTGGFGTLGSALQLLVVAWGAAIASFPLNDNSFFTHLATGRIILESGSVPSSDPYTFTARGADWTVQSWLASVAYAAAERAGGVVGLRLLVLVVFVAAALLLWRLSRPAESVFARVGVVFGALFVCTGLWSERPMMIGVIGLAIVWLALDGAIRPWLLAPLMWVWANSHGSFPLAGVLIGAVLIGEIFDLRHRGVVLSPRNLREELRTELSVLKATVAGTLLAVIGPLGIDVLLFPLKTFSRSGMLGEIVEWQAPGFRSVSERAFLALVLATIVGIVRQRRWRFAVPVIVFVGAALVAQRNVVMATIVLVPVLAACAPSWGTLTVRTRPSLGKAFAAVAAVTAAAVCAVAVAAPFTALGRYPVNAIVLVDRVAVSGSDTRIAAQDITGNFLSFLDGPNGAVFIDDRADMFPADVFEDYLALLRGEPGWAEALDDHDIDVVVWDRSKPLGSLVAADRRWRVAFSDTDWVVSCRRAADVCDGLRATTG